MLDEDRLQKGRAYVRRTGAKGVDPRTVDRGAAGARAGAGRYGAHVVSAFSGRQHHRRSRLGAARSASSATWPATATRRSSRRWAAFPTCCSASSSPRWWRGTSCAAAASGADSDLSTHQPTDLSVPTALACRDGLPVDSRRRAGAGRFGAAVGSVVNGWFGRIGSWRWECRRGGRAREALARGLPGAVPGRVRPSAASRSCTVVRRRCHAGPSRRSAARRWRRRQAAQGPAPRSRPFPLGTTSAAQH